MSDTILTQEQIDELIDCRKRIVRPPKKQRSTVHGCLRNDMMVQDLAGRHFDVFMRQSVTFQENFSVGLIYLPKGGPSMILLRCNGPHGEVIDPDEQTWHDGPHVHRALEKNLREGRRPERGATPTTDYASYDGALLHFLRLTNIEYTKDHFPDLRQGRLFDGDG